MRTSTKLWTWLMVSVLCALGASTASDAEILDIPGEYDTLEEAAAAATSGDTIRIGDGIWTGPGFRNVSLPEVGWLTILGANGADATIIDAEDLGNVLRLGPGGACLQGITLRNGKAASGGLVAASDGGMILVDCCFESSSTTGGNGSAIIAYGAFEATGCTFRGNSGPSVIYLEQGGIEITDCAFQDNMGICLQIPDMFGTVEGCRFERNADWCVRAYFHSNPVIRGCEFVENTRTLAALGDDLLVEDSRFIGNGSLVGENVLWIVEATVTLRRSLFVENEGEAIVKWDYTGIGSVFVESCTFADNHATSGVLSIDSSSAGMDLQGAIDRTIIALNHGGPAVHHVGDPSNDPPDFLCTDIYGNEGGDWTDWIDGFLGVSGNFAADPLFCGGGFPGTEWNLQPESPCLPGQHPDGADCGLIGALDEGCVSVGVSTALSTAPAFELHARPNPFHAGTILSLEEVAVGGWFELYDATGRAVTRLAIPSHTSRVRWDGTDAAGRLVPAGVYYVRAVTPGGAALGVGRLTRLP